MKYTYLIMAITLLTSCNSTTEEKKIKEIIKTSNGSTTVYIQKYDERDNLILSERDFDLYGPSDEIYKYYYENNNLVKEEWFFRDGSKTELYMTDYYTYNPDNTVNTKVRKDSDDNIYWEYKYDHKFTNGERETKIAQYEANGELMQEWLYKYDSIDRLVQKPIDFQGSIYGYQKYQYSGKNSVKVIEFNEDGLPKNIESYKIDDKGNYLDVDSDNTQYKWKYDKYGNWIEKEIIRENGGWTEFREIHYY